jgi:hypothetical protein
MGEFVSSMQRAALFNSGLASLSRNCPLFRFREVIWGYASITPFRYIGPYLDTSIGFNTIPQKFIRTHSPLPCFAIL